MKFFSECLNRRSKQRRIKMRESLCRVHADGVEASRGHYFRESAYWHRALESAFKRGYKTAQRKMYGVPTPDYGGGDPPPDWLFK